jgi:ATP synthase protein I
MSLRLDSDAATRPAGLVGGRRELWTGMDHASIMSVELLASILTWTGLGWLADRALGTAPWFIVIGGLIGNAAGLYLVWLRSGRMEGGGAPEIQADRGGAGAR